MSFKNKEDIGIVQSTKLSLHLCQKITGVSMELPPIQLKSPTYTTPLLLTKFIYIYIILHPCRFFLLYSQIEILHLLQKP